MLWSLMLPVVCIFADAANSASCISVICYQLSIVRYNLKIDSTWYNMILSWLNLLILFINTLDAIQSKKRETPERVNTTGNHKASKAQSQKSQSQEYGIFTQPCHALRFLCSSCWVSTQLSNVELFPWKSKLPGALCKIRRGGSEWD